MFYFLLLFYFFLQKIHLEAVEEFQNTIKKKENRIVELENKVSLLRTNASDLVFKCDMEQQLLDIEKKHAFQVRLTLPIAKLAICYLIYNVALNNSAFVKKRSHKNAQYICKLAR